MFISNNLMQTNLYQWSNYVQAHIQELQAENPNTKLAAKDFNGLGFWIDDVISKLDPFGNADIISYLANLKDRLETLYMNLNFVATPLHPNVMVEQHQRLLQIACDVKYVLQFLKRQVVLQFKKHFEMGPVALMQKLTHSCNQYQLQQVVLVTLKYDSNRLMGYTNLADLQIKFDPQLKRINQH